MEITIKVDDKLIEAISKLAEAIGGGKTEATAPSDEPKADGPKMGAMIPAEPESQEPESQEGAATPDRREWLVEKITSHGGTIPPRTRTTTLEKMWSEICKKEQQQPAEEKPAAAETDEGLFDEQPTAKELSPQETTDILKDFINSQDDPQPYRVKAISMFEKLFGEGARKIPDNTPSDVCVKLIKSINPAYEG
jgi:hypothetical protein